MRRVLGWMAGIVCTMVVLTATPVYAEAPAPSVTQQAQNQLDSLPTGTIESFWNQLQMNYGEYMPDVAGEGIVQALTSGHGFRLKSMLHGVIRYFFAELLDNAGLIGGILILAVLAALLESMRSAFESQTVGQVANAVVFMVLMVLAIRSFTEAIGYAHHAIQSMSDFMLASVPVMIAVLAASGNVASAAFFHPMMAFSVEVITNVVFLFVFPLIFFAAILDITSAISPRYQLTRLAGLFRGVGVLMLGVSFSVFIGISAVQGISKGVVDGVALRAAKFGLSTFIPIIGKSLSDAWETVASASLLVKNAVGTSLMIIVAFIALFPAIKVLVMSLVYHGSAALLQPLGDTPMIPCLVALGRSLILVFACVAAVAVMFFVSVCILLAAANVAGVMT